MCFDLERKGMDMDRVFKLTLTGHEACGSEALRLDTSRKREIGEDG